MNYQEQLTAAKNSLRPIGEALRKMNYQQQLKQLTAAFPAHDIEWRVGQEIKGKGDKPYAMVFAYVTSRAIMNRLDQVFGIGGWRDEYEVLSQGVVCRLSCLIDGEWITKTDAAPFTDIESLKGGFSDAFKRAGVKFGIGRYLYDLPRSQVPLLPEWIKDAKFHRGKDKQNYYWLPPDLPEWAVPPTQLEAGKTRPQGEQTSGQAQDRGADVRQDQAGL